MNSRKLRLSAVLALAACLVLGAAGQAHAVLVGIQIEVFKNGISQGTAFGAASTSTNTPLIVIATTGDTLRFVVMLTSDPATNTGSFSTPITGDLNNSAGGANELSFVAGSATALGGGVFVTLGQNPNSQLNDTTPMNGNSSSTAGSWSTQNLYRVDYIVGTVVTDALRDFSAVLTGYTSSPAVDLADVNLDSASVRVDGVPEPSSFFLLGSGLAAIAGMLRRRR